MSRYVKTLGYGLAKSRSRSPSISLQKLIDSAKTAAFFEEVKHAYAVSDDEAIEAARLLSKSPRERKRTYVEGGAVSAVAAPVIQGLGRGIEAGVDARRGARLHVARKAFRNTTRGGVARAALTGGLGAIAISAGREGIQLQRAREKYHRFLEQHDGAAHKA